MIVGMRLSQLRTLAGVLCAASLLAACDTMAPAVKPATGTPARPGATTPGVKPPPGSPGNPVAAVVAPHTEQQSLKEGIDLYNRGAYNEAIRRLSGPEVMGGSRATQLKALKFTAFSYCLTSRTTLCRTTFEKAFKIDPAFALDAGETGHPMWTPSFNRARAGKAGLK